MSRCEIHENAVTLSKIFPHLLKGTCPTETFSRGSYSIFKGLPNLYFEQNVPDPGLKDTARIYQDRQLRGVATKNWQESTSQKIGRRRKAANPQELD
jgi:hypothetical protein